MYDLMADSIVTAENAFDINDGAVDIVLVSEEKVKELGLVPMAECGGELGGVDSAIMGVGSVKLTKKLCRKRNITIDDIDLIEENEALVAQSIAVGRELNFPQEK